jgi:hypothetical protein
MPAMTEQIFNTDDQWVNRLLSVFTCKCGKGKPKDAATCSQCAAKAKCLDTMAEVKPTEEYLDNLLRAPYKCPLGSALILEKEEEYCAVNSDGAPRFPNAHTAARYLRWPIGLCDTIAKAYDDVAEYPDNFVAGIEAGKMWLRREHGGLSNG